MSSKEQLYERVVNNITCTLFRKVKCLKNRQSRDLITRIINAAESTLRVCLLSSPDELQLYKKVTVEEVNKYITKASIAMLSYSYNTLIPDTFLKNLYERSWQLIINDFNDVMGFKVTKKIIDKYETTMGKGKEKMSHSFSTILPGTDSDVNTYDIMRNVLKDNFIIGSELATDVWGIKIPKNAIHTLLRNFSQSNEYNSLDLCFKQAIYIGNNLFLAYGQLIAPSLQGIFKKLIKKHFRKDWRETKRELRESEKFWRSLW
jgi:hypothetical protein